MVEVIRDPLSDRLDGIIPDIRPPAARVSNRQRGAYFSVMVTLCDHVAGKVRPVLRGRGG